MKITNNLSCRDRKQILEVEKNLRKLNTQGSACLSACHARPYKEMRPMLRGAVLILLEKFEGSS